MHIEVLWNGGLASNSSVLEKLHETAEQGSVHIIRANTQGQSLEGESYNLYDHLQPHTGATAH